MPNECVRNSVRLKNKALENQGLYLILAVRTGLEPATPCVTGMYSNQLNYRTVFYLGSAKIDFFCYNG